MRRTQRHKDTKTQNKKFSVAILIFLIFSFIPFVQAAENSKETVRILSEMPVQHNGRVKPYASFAREVLLGITGKEQYKRKPATEALWRWMAKPEESASTPLLPVSYKKLQDDFPLMVIGGKIPPELVLNNQPFLEKAQKAYARKQRKEKISYLDQKRLELYDRATLFQQVTTGQIPGWIAHPGDEMAGWLPAESLLSEQGRRLLMQFFSEEHVNKAAADLEALLQTWKTKPKASAAAAFRDSVNRLFESKGVALNRTVLGYEITYNRLNPFHWAWIFYLFSAIFFALVLMLKQKITAVWSDIPSSGLWMLWGGTFCFLAGFGIHLYGFVLRCLIAGRPPVTNMYESMIWVSWGVALFSMILFISYRAIFIPMISSIVAAIVLILAQSFPAVLDASLTPLVPVLRSNFWLTVHVLTITLSYAAFALAWGIGHAAIIRFVAQPKKTEANKKLVEFLYRAVQIGVILLAAGTVLGGVWANYSWGRFWGWDPKETWALIALLGYLLVLHGRFTGWLDAFGLAAGCVVAFLGIVMAWYGVNFVLGVGLHSYGFGGGGAVYVLTAALMDLIFVGVLTRLYKEAY